jgi:hypothetical protein
MSQDRCFRIESLCVKEGLKCSRSPSEAAGTMEAESPWLVSIMEGNDLDVSEDEKA